MTTIVVARKCGVPLCAAHEVLLTRSIFVIPLIGDGNANRTVNITTASLSLHVTSYWTAQLQNIPRFWDITLCDSLKPTDVSKEHTASIFSFEYADKYTSAKADGKPAFTLISCSVYSKLKMEALRSSEMSLDFK
jgi:hypothetical protein